MRGGVKMDAIKIQEDLDLLDACCNLSLTLNDLRIIVNCFRGIAYQMKIDDEPYLDQDGVALKSKLEKLYKDKLRELGTLSSLEVKTN
jgi:hypothetical protein